MIVRKIKPLNPINNHAIEPKRPVVKTVVKQNKTIVPWLQCPKCKGSMSREIVSKEFVEKTGCKCRGKKIVITYKYLCTTCGYYEIRT